MSEALLVGLMVFATFVGTFLLAEWGARHWVRRRREREQAFDDQRADWPPERN